MAKKQQDDAKTVTPVTVYMPNSLMEMIDEAAVRERRQRSPQIVVLVEEALNAREAEAAASK